MSKLILAKLMAKKASLVAPSVSEFWAKERAAIFAAQGGDSSLPSHAIHAQLTTEQLEEAYVEGNKKCEVVYDDYFKQVDALDFAIKHYEGQIKLELALSLIEEEDQVTEETPPVQFMVFQCGHDVFGFGSDLAEAIEDANQWSSEEIKYSDVECYDSAQPHADGKIYWTTHESVINSKFQ